LQRPEVRAITRREHVQTDLPGTFHQHPQRRTHRRLGRVTLFLAQVLDIVDEHEMPTPFPRLERGSSSWLFELERAARSRVRYAVEDARAAGFKVHEDLSVTDRMTGRSAAQRAARQAQAQTFAADIGQRSAQLVGLDHRVASKITAAVAGIRHAFPQIPVPASPSQDDRVDAVGNHIFKQEPTITGSGRPERHDRSAGTCSMGRRRR
jgi:hypothetical protein